MTDEIPIKIIVPPETDAEVIPVLEEAPLLAERPSRNIGAQVKQTAVAASQQVANAAQKVWRTEARRKATRGLKRGTTAAVVKGSKLVQDKVVAAAEHQAREQAAAVQTRLKETDWKAEAQTGAAKTLRWLSARLSSLAARLIPAKEPTAPIETPPTPSSSQDS